MKVLPPSLIRLTSFASTVSIGYSVTLAVKETDGDYGHYRSQEKSCQGTDDESRDIDIACKDIADSVELSVNRKVHVEVCSV